MYLLKNTTNGKIVKNAITCKPMTFDTLELANKWAKNLERRSKLDSTAFNGVRSSKYEIISA